VDFSYIKWLCFFALTLALLSQPLIAHNTIAAEEQSCKAVNSPTKQHRPSGAYCGAYCLYAVMRVADIDIDPKELLKPEYIGSAGGSSLAELKKAAEDYGMYAAVVGRLTTRELRQSPYPIILHVKSAADKKGYDHYELFLETKNGQARLYDPPEPVRVVPFYELAPRWDGTGLIVSADRPQYCFCLCSKRVCNIWGDCHNYYFDDSLGQSAVVSNRSYDVLAAIVGTVCSARHRISTNGNVMRDDLSFRQ
jgi:hypothetical protein